MAPTSLQAHRPAAVARRGTVLATLALLYTAQGIPFGFASEYLPVVLREAHYTRTQIAAVFWLQLPWQLKLLWAHVADRPSVRARSRSILLAVQLALAVAVALYAPFDVRSDLGVWLVLTGLCALIAATQDVFVDALAVRSLAPKDRGYGNIAQVAGYRLGMLAGGAGLLVAVGRFGQPATLLACAGVVAVASAGAFALRDEEASGLARPEETTGVAFRAASPPPARKQAAQVWAVVRDAFGPKTWPVLALAATFKLGPHVATVLIKPMAVDAHWSTTQIGYAVVTVGTTAALLGAAAGGVFYRAVREARALAIAALFQGLACLPLVAARAAGVPVALTTGAIAAEHFASGFGTTVLFAALMTATRPSSAAMQYTLLTSANQLAMGLGGLLGGVLGDGIGETKTYAIAAALSLAPLPLLAKWSEAASASSAEREA